MGKYKYEINNLFKYIDKAGLAETEEEYSKYFDLTFKTLDSFDLILQNNKYLNGDEIGDDDIDLYKILIRFDIIFYFAYKLNKKHIWEYKNLFRLEESLYKSGLTDEYNDLDEVRRVFYIFRSNIKNPYHLVLHGSDPRDRFGK